MPLHVYRMRNGNLRVPDVLEDEANGFIGTLLKEVPKGSPEWERWKDEVRRGLVIESLDWREATHPQGA